MRGGGRGFLGSGAGFLGVVPPSSTALLTVLCLFAANAALTGLFPVVVVEVIPYDNVRDMGVVEREFALVTVTDGGTTSPVVPCAVFDLGDDSVGGDK